MHADVRRYTLIDLAPPRVRRTRQIRRGRRFLIRVHLRTSACICVKFCLFERTIRSIVPALGGFRTGDGSNAIALASALTTKFPLRAPFCRRRAGCRRRFPRRTLRSSYRRGWRVFTHQDGERPVLAYQGFGALYRSALRPTLRRRPPVMPTQVGIHAFLLFQPKAWMARLRTP
jgi:hypothetical protein